MQVDDSLGFRDKSVTVVVRAILARAKRVWTDPLYVEACTIVAKAIFGGVPDVMALTGLRLVVWREQLTA